MQVGSGNTEHLRGGAFGTPQGGSHNKHARKVLHCKPYSYRSLNMFKSCLVEHGCVNCSSKRVGTEGL